jgi:hypothetical protein
VGQELPAPSSSSERLRKEIERPYSKFNITIFELSDRAKIIHLFHLPLAMCFSRELPVLPVFLYIPNLILSDSHGLRKKLTLLLRF